MRFFNIFYLVLLLLGCAFAYYMQLGNTEVLSFFGVAESNETEINYNHSIVVDQILVQPGQNVTKGDVLLKVSRIKSKETMTDNGYRIAEVNADIALLNQKKRDEIASEEQKLALDLQVTDEKIAELEKELAFKTALAKDLSSIETEGASYRPIEDKIANLSASKTRAIESSRLKIEAINREKKLAVAPYTQQIARIEAEANFDESQKRVPLTVVAPADGLIGYIYCKEAEHVPSYKTLMSFYEPHSSIIKGYVHEDLTLKVKLNDVYQVSSIKDPNISYEGKVTGLGSRIVEIPARLRKMADIKTFGREVLIEIDADNSFLQKEKVALSYSRGHE